MNAPFDTLAFTDRLKGTRLGQAGAETLARAMADVVMQDVATKADVKEAVHTLTVRFGVMLGTSVGVLIAAFSVAVAVFSR